MSNDQWEFKQMLTRALIPFDEKVMGPVTVVTFPLQPSAHGVGEIEGSAHFDMHGRLQGICYESPRALE